MVTAGLGTERIVVVRDGVRLAVRDHGPRHPEATVVLLHGLCLDKGSWADQIRQLTRQWGDRIRIISYDHRCHGRSDSASKPGQRESRRAFPSPVRNLR
ncbi:hypothetical protein A5724_22660 [Mycobacterium sp. ACS1612]|uniref:alpha/beta fold hydrolase n=1 Tax=Mycobacterium sp. ACS1612 TaxID=1834117 RepID=UPI0007FB9EF4|nr:alpha/beta fold hydrolase [Mycobacterium sp. ACS1612]OBF30822.1 hypothetical protein A5724_22660 [Mycobacterium sp. ACS1612]